MCSNASQFQTVRMSRNDLEAVGADRPRRSKDGDPLSLLMIGIHQDKDSHSESDKAGQFAATLVSYFNCTLPHAVPHSRYRVREGQESSAEFRIRRGLYHSGTIRRPPAGAPEFLRNSCSIRTPDTWTKPKCDGGIRTQKSAQRFGDLHELFKDENRLWMSSPHGPKCFSSRPFDDHSNCAIQAQERLIPLLFRVIVRCDSLQ